MKHLRIAHALVAGIAMASWVAAADAPFRFDLQLATDLASAYVRAEQRARPDLALPGIAYEHPDVTSRVAKGGRRLVYVTFKSAKPSSGATVVLELCSATSDLTVVDVAWTDGLENYLRDVGSINDSTYVALPEACPEGTP